LSPDIALSLSNYTRKSESSCADNNNINCFPWPEGFNGS